MWFAILSPVISALALIATIIIAIYTLRNNKKGIAIAAANLTLAEDGDERETARFWREDAEAVRKRLEAVEQHFKLFTEHSESQQSALREEVAGLTAKMGQQSGRIIELEARLYRLTEENMRLKAQVAA